MECQIKKNLKNCPCTYPECDKKGKCCQCLKYHLNRNELPACCFSSRTEKTYNRSFDKFTEEQKS